MLKQRIITAFFLIPLTLLVLFYLPLQAFAYLTAFIALAAAWEWSSLMQVKRRARFGYLLFIICGFVAALFIPVINILAIAAIWWLIATTLIVIYPHASAYYQHFFWRGMMGLLIIVPCWVAINYIRSQPQGLYLLLFLFVLVWGADSTAYFVGKKWGKHKLAPMVSPGKTIQGIIGALCFTLIYITCFLWLLKMPLHLWSWCFILALCTVLFSIIGDLFESLIKRQAGVKDSGTLLPGHGGLLDRIDSLTAAAPIFAFGAWMLSRYLP